MKLDSNALSNAADKWFSKEYNKAVNSCDVVKMQDLLANREMLLEVFAEGYIASFLDISEKRLLSNKTEKIKIDRIIHEKRN